MSSANMDQLFLKKFRNNVANEIAKFLRYEHENEGAAIKRIGASIKKELDEVRSFRTVRNWYEGRCCPNLYSFITLAKAYPGLILLFLNLCNRSDLAILVSTYEKVIKTKEDHPQVQIYKVDFDILNQEKNWEAILDINMRQIWFYEQLKEGQKISAKHLAHFGKVGIATARRDIQKLKNLGLVCFVGARKNGYYIAIT